MADQPATSSHAYFVADSRRRKAQKIARLLSDVCRLPGAHVLETGTGSGYIAAHFADLVGAAGAVHATDVADQRVVRAGFAFSLVSDTALPFAAETFDICISNHVIEHVGDRAAQLHHLQEMHRVLRPGGWLYLAVPNRWTLVEPHFRLPFLSWLPRAWRDAYVRAMGRGARYDCDPPDRRTIEQLLHAAHYTIRDVSFDGIKLVAELEVENRLLKRLLAKPLPWAHPLRGLLPSFLYLGRK